MTKSLDEPLALRIGAVSVAENLRRAVAAGNLIEHEDGTLELPAAQATESNWIRVVNAPRPDCTFLRDFLFRRAYAKSAVPTGCSACYKIRVVPRTLRELMAAWEIGKHIECNSKWGVDFDNPYSRNFYSGVLYGTGLEMTRAIFKIAREAFNEHPALGPDVAMTIKRGCSEYEEALGPSDGYEFAPETLEVYLKSRYRRRKRNEKRSMPQARWIDVASRIGDDTYLDFTGGKRLRPRRVTYDP